MGFMDRAVWALGDKTGFLMKRLDEWHPRGCKTEKQYEKLLYAYFHTVLPKRVQVTRQYALGRTRADLVVGTVIVELKNNLNTTGKLQRLIGQISLYEDWDGKVLVLLVGKTDANIRKQLDAFVKKKTRGFFPTFDVGDLVVYQKGKGE